MSQKADKMFQRKISILTWHNWTHNELNCLQTIRGQTKAFNLNTEVELSNVRLGLYFDWRLTWELLVQQMKPKRGSIAGVCKSSIWTANSLKMYMLWKSLDCVLYSLLVTTAPQNVSPSPHLLSSRSHILQVLGLVKYVMLRCGNVREVLIDMSQLRLLMYPAAPSTLRCLIPTSGLLHQYD